MNAQDLKNSILQLAIQGKLVEQREEEGTAEKLYQQIQEEKAKLIKKGKIKKEKPQPQITENEISFDIPENWKWVRLGGISKNIHYGYTASARDTGSCKLLRITDIQDNAVSWESVPFCNVKESEYITYGLNNRDIMIARTGGTIGKTYIVESLEERAVFASYLIRSIPVDNINENYLKKFMESPLYWNQLKAGSMGTGQPNVNGTALKNLVLPLPPLEEQKRIVAKIEELMPYVKKYGVAYSEVEELNKKFPEDMQKSILQYAIQGKLVEQREEDGTAEELYQQIQKEKEKLIKEGKIKKTKELPEIKEVEIPFDIPENWKWVYLNDISFVTKLAGFEYTKYLTNAILPQGEIPIVRAKNIKPNKFMENKEEFITKELSEKLSRCALDTRCVLMTFIGAGIGEVAIFENKRRNHLAPNVAKIVPHLDINNYLLYYLMSYSGRGETFKFMKRTAQPSLSMETIRKIIVPLPPLEVQKRIVEKVEELLPYAKQLVKLDDHAIIGVV